MKLFSKYFLALVAAGLLFAACDDDDDFSAGPTVDGQGFFFHNSGTDFTLDASATSFDITVGRSVTGEAVSAAIESSVTLTTSDGVVDASGAFSIPASVYFEADQLEATLTIGYDPDEIGYETYSFNLSLEGTGNTTPYGVANYSFTAGIPEPWVSLGKATFHDDFFFYYDYQVELQQNELDPTQFRLVDPYAEGLETEGYVSEASRGTYLTFRVMQPGEMLHDTQITTTGLVFFDPYDTGYYYSSYASELWIYHPSAFTNWQTEDSWSHSKVVSFASDGVTPAIVQLAPLYYLPDYGGYWNYSTYDGMVTIVFPGAVISDYSTSISYGGIYTDTNETTSAIANVSLGADVATARVAVVEGKDASAALDAVLNGTVDYTEVTSSGNVTIPFDGSGDFTLIVVSYDASGEAQEYDYSYFEYYGGGGSPWTSLGMCTYTDDFFTTFWYVDNVSWEVEIQENNDTQGLYRLVYPYDGKYYYNDPGDWDTSSTYYMEINACDPDGVYITPQEIGVDWAYGMISVSSMAAYYMSAGYSFDEVKDAGYCGTMVNGVITFPEDCLLIGMADYYNGGWFTANSNGAFKVVMPGASGVKAKKVSAARQLSDKTVKATATPFSRGQMLRNAPVRRDAKMMK